MFNFIGVVGFTLGLFFSSVFFSKANACTVDMACISGTLLSSIASNGIANNQEANKQQNVRGKVVAHSLSKVNIFETQLSDNNHFSLALAPDDSYQVSFILHGHVKRTFQLTVSKNTDINFDVALGGAKLAGEHSLVYLMNENGRYLGKTSLEIKDGHLISQKTLPKGSVYGWLLWAWQSADALYVGNQAVDYIKTFDIYLPKIDRYIKDNKLNVPLDKVNQNEGYRVDFQQASPQERAQINASLAMYNRQYQGYYLEKNNPEGYQAFLEELSFERFLEKNAGKIPDSSDLENQYRLASTLKVAKAAKAPSARFALAHYPVQHAFWAIDPELYLKAVTLSHKNSDKEQDSEALARAKATIGLQLTLFENSAYANQARFILEKALIELAEYQFKADEVATRFARLRERYHQYPKFERFNRKYGPENPIAVGRALPGFSLNSLDNPGEVLENTTFAGKVFLLDAWTSWCAPCRDEVPYYQKAYQKYHDQGFEILSVNFDVELEAMKAFRQEFAMPWHHHYNGGSLQTKIGKALNVVNFPITILVDEKGTVIANGLAIRGKNLDRVLKQLYARHNG